MKITPILFLLLACGGAWAQGKPVDYAVDGATAGMVFQHPEHQLLGRTVVEDIAQSLPGGRRRSRHRAGSRGADQHQPKLEARWPLCRITRC